MTLKPRLIVPARPRGPSRRTVLASAGAMGAAGALNLAAPGLGWAQPKSGGSIRVAKGHGSTSDTLNPANWTNGYVLAMAYGIHGYLTRVAADGSLEMEMAESFEASNGAKTWVVKLRPGITFHSGKSFTSADVVANLNYHRGDDSTSAAKPLLAPITDMVAEDDLTVRFELASGNADFPFVFTAYQLAMCPTNDGEVDWRSGDGAGAYKLVNFEPGVRLEVTRREDDWYPGTRGYITDIELISMVDSNARTTALVSGDVHAIDRVDLKTIGLLERNRSLTISSIPGNQHYTFAMHCNTAPFNDVHVRQAMKHGIDRQELLDKVLFGYGSLGNDHPIGRGQRFFNTELAQTPYDPDRAKYHLQQAGLDSLRVELAAADAAFSGAVDAALLYQTAAEPGSITIDVNRVPSDGYWADVWLKHPFCAVYWGGRPTEDEMFSVAYAEGAAWNDTKWSNERFNALLVEARAELDEDKRRQMYWEMQTLVNQDGGAIIPMFANYNFATGPDVVLPEQMSSHWDMDGERWMERWSMA